MASTDIDKSSKSIKKQISPKALQKLQKYFSIRTKLFNYFFKKQPLDIKHPQTMAAYNDVYSVMNNMHQRFKQNNKYESYDETFLNQYKKDLSKFCQKSRELIKLSTNMKPEQFIQYVLEWIYNYNRFMHWTFKIFMIIEKNSLHAQGTNLYFEGLNILRNQMIKPIYEELFSAIYSLLDKFKQKQLGQYEPIQQIIKIIGIIGFQKIKYIKLEKLGEKFMFVSKHATAQVQLETQYFKRQFTKKLIAILNQKYRNLSDDMIKLSTPQYVTKALSYLQLQQQTIDIFYPNKQVKQSIIRNLQQILSHQKAQILIKKPGTGLFSMLQRGQLKDAKKLFELIKRSSNFKLYTKQYQRFIQTKGNQILDKVSAQDEKQAKKQQVSELIEQLYKLYELMERITGQVANNDTEIKSSQTFGFQQICNKTEKVCNFLAYYSDNMLRKQQDSLNEQSDLKTKILKISKYLYSYDAFIKLYQRLLGLRMLFDNFKKKQLELEIINVLKNEAGVSPLNKISCMVTDFLFSQNFNNEKVSELKKQAGFNLEVMVLTSGSWQIHDAKNGKSAVPPELTKAAEIFEKIYSEQLPDRTLTWVFNYGRAIVLAHFDNQVKHVLILNNYQLCILLYLQRIGFKPTKLSQILQQLKIDDEPAFNASLMMLVKIKILLKEGNPTKIDSKNETFEFNLKFKYQTMKVRCFQLPRFIEKGNSQAGELILQRSHLVDAAIVKIMKSKRVAQYNDLIAEVQKMCKTFKAETGLIKKRIENCQQRQFLQRDPNDMNTLLYKP